jgi:hypothetical protein
VGAFVSGITSDILWGQRAATAVLFALISMPIFPFFPSTQLREIAMFEAAGGTENASLILTLTPYWSAPGTTVMDAGDIYNIARLCIFISGFAMNGPKTLLGMCIRSSVQNSKVVGTVGGLLGLIGQCGAYSGSMLLSTLLTGKSSQVYSLASSMSSASHSAVLGFMRGSGGAFGAHAEVILAMELSAWELFPVLYMLCGAVTVVLLAIPAVCEAQRYINTQQELLSAGSKKKTD